MKILSERKRSHELVGSPLLISSGVQVGSTNFPTCGSSSSDHQIPKKKEDIVPISGGASEIAFTQKPTSSSGSGITCTLKIRHDRGDTKVGKTVMSVQDIYHEKQEKARCALHTLNNLFQGPVFTKEDLDSICNTLAPDAWVNPHKSVLGLGNYDINVIMTALLNKDYEAVWFDKRKDPASLNLSDIFGFIFNIPTDTKVGWVSIPLKRKHWFAVRNFGEDYYNLDSKMSKPMLIGRDSALITFFREQLQSKDKELFIVINQETNRTQSWNFNSSNNGQPYVFSVDGASPSAIVARKQSIDSGVVELLEKDADLNIVDLNKEPDEDERHGFSILRKEL